jgi:transposase-like protein
MRKRCFKVKDKLLILRKIAEARTRVENRLSLQAACDIHQINPSMYYKWRRKEPEYIALRNRKAYSLNQKFGT